MATLTEASSFDASVYEFATNDLIQGGPGGTDNIPHQQLTNRTRWLYDNKLSRDGSQSMTGKLTVTVSSGDAELLSTPNGVNTVLRMTQASVGSATMKVLSGGALTIGLDGSTGDTERIRLSADGGTSIGSGASKGSGTLYVPGVYVTEPPAANTVGGIVGSGNVADVFTVDSTKKLNHYGLVWQTFSDASLGPSASLSGFGGVRIYTYGAERMRIDSSGNVGIGNAAPDSKLSVNGGDVHIRSGSLCVSDFVGSVMGSVGSFHGDAANGGLVFCTRAADALVERMRISSAGDVGIGTTSPTTNTAYRSFVINGSAAALIQHRVGENTYAGWYTDPGISQFHSTPLMSFSVAGAERLRIDSSGSVGIGLSPSYRFHVGQSVAAGYATSAFENSNGAGYVQTYYNVGADGASGRASIAYAPGASGFFAIGPTANDTATPVVIRTNNATERMRIDASGNVGIGTTAPGAKLDVVGAVNHATPAAGDNSTLSATTAWVRTYVSGAVPVTSVAGKTGAVALSTSDVSEGSNLYFTSARASAAAPVQSINGRVGAVTGITEDAEFTGTNQSLATNGYQKLPGGLILQWGVYTGDMTVPNGSAPSAANLFYPITFPNACLNISLTTRNTGNDYTADSWPEARTPGPSSVFVQPQSSGTGSPVLHGFFWMAIGY